MLYVRLFLMSILICFFSACANKTASFTGKTESERINKFFEWSFNKIIERQPMEMSYYGIKKRQGELNNLSFAYQKQTHRMVVEHLGILRDFSRDKLNSADRLSYDVYEKMALMAIEDWQWQDYSYVVNQMFGIQQALPGFMISVHQVKNEEDLQNYVSRLNEFKNFFGDVISQVMRSEAKGVVPPKFVFSLVIPDSKNVIRGYPFEKSKKESPLYADFMKKMKQLKLTLKKQKKYKAAAIKALQNSVKPGYQSLISFLQEQEKRSTTDHGVWKFPQGEKYYQSRLKAMTTTNYTPEQIHQLGLSNVQRIHGEMNAIRKKLKFKGDLKAFFKYMDSSRFLYKNNKSGRKTYMKVAKGYIDKMRSQLDQFFLTKPKAAIEVKAVEPFREKSSGMAFYNNGTPDGSRPGTYYVNLVNMKALPKWEAEALAYHEGIPGHHMQLSIAQELESIPKFRRFHWSFTSYVEGWGLYSEKFPKDYGFYKDPHSDFGRLSMELTRACRLVVDSGLHYKKWTRDQAITYLDENTPGDHADNVRQINRYIVMPGQATAYLVGMLKIVELKEKAKKALGAKFDIRKFHDVILTNGAVPLDILETLIDNYIKESLG